MGGCNSVLNDIELAGAFVAAGVATVATDGEDVAAAEVAGAGSLGSYFATKKGCNKSKAALVQATNEVIATAIILSLTTCNSQDFFSQVIEIKCDPQLPPGEVYEQNAACGSCNQAVFGGMLAQHDLERKLWGQGKEVKVRLPIDQEYVLMLGRLGTCGVNTCKACSLANVTQASLVKAESDCYQQITNVQSFKTNLTNLVQQQLVNNQDVLSGVAKAFGAEGVNKLTEKVTNQIVSNVTSTFLNNTTNLMKGQQVVRVNQGGSVTANNISQYTAFNVALQEVTSAQITERSISDAVFTTIAEVANQQNTLNDIGEVVFESTVDFTKAINNSVGKVMLAVLVALGLVVLFIIGYALYRFFRKVTISSENLARKIETQQANLSAFDQF